MTSRLSSALPTFLIALAALSPASRAQAPAAPAAPAAKDPLWDPTFSWGTSYHRCSSFAGGACTSFSGPVRSRFMMGLHSALFPDSSTDGVNGQRDNVLMWGYNYDLTGGRITAGEPAFKQQIESSYWDGGQQLVEYNWDYMSAAGKQWRPFYYIIRTGPAGDAGFPLDTSLLDVKMCENCANLQLTPFGSVNIGIQDRTQRWARLLVDHTILEQGPGTNASRFGAMDLMSFDLASSGDLGLFAGSLARARWMGQKKLANTVSMIAGQQAFAEITGEGMARRSVENFTAGVDAHAWFAGTGFGNGSSELIGVRAQASAHGSGPYKVNGYGIKIASPAKKGDAVIYENGAGLWVEDMKGYGEQAQGAIVVASQTGGGGAKGNLVLLGGGFDDGHIVAGSGHLWWDGEAGIWRVKGVPPVESGDGRALVAGSGSQEFGPVLWSLKPSASCSSVCGKAGLGCQDAYPLAGGGAVGCADTQAAKSCLCR